MEYGWFGPRLMRREDPDRKRLQRQPLEYKNLSNRTVVTRWEQRLEGKKQSRRLKTKTVDRRWALG